MYIQIAVFPLMINESETSVLSCLFHSCIREKHSCLKAPACVPLLKNTIFSEITHRLWTCGTFRHNGLDPKLFSASGRAYTGSHFPHPHSITDFCTAWTHFSTIYHPHPFSKELRRLQQKGRGERALLSTGSNLI